jgi:hypothetical protein
LHFNLHIKILSIYLLQEVSYALFFQLNLLIMKEKFTIKSLFLLTMACFIISPVFGQKTVTKSVPGDYVNVQDAMAYINAVDTELESGDSYVINVGEGVFNAPTTNNLLSWPEKKLFVLIQGAGADKTFQRPNNAELNSRIPLATQGTRWIQISGDPGEKDGSTLTIKDMTYQYMGSFSTNLGVGSGLNITATFALNILLENVVYDNCVGPAIVNVPQMGPTLAIENCLFKQCVATSRDGGIIFGMVRKKANNFTIRNTTFFSNEFQDVADPPTYNGYIIYAQVDEIDPSSNVVLENNAFVNNRYVNNRGIEVEPTTRNPIITIQSTELGVNNLTMVNNILIGNGRSGQVNDVDLWIPNPTFINWVASSGNILNTAITSTEVEGVYAPLTFDGSKIDPSYTYLDPRIAFTMEGDLPALTLDANFIGGVTYTGDGGVVGIEKNADGSIKAYVYNRTMVVDGLRSGDLVEVYTVLGSLYKRSVATANRLEAELPTGLYIVRSGSFTQKLMVK